MTFIFTFMKLDFLVNQQRASCPLYFFKKEFALFIPHSKPKNQPHPFHLDRHILFQIFEQL